jgi:hypothetical protein
MFVPPSFLLDSLSRGLSPTFALPRYGVAGTRSLRAQRAIAQRAECSSERLDDRVCDRL